MDDDHRILSRFDDLVEVADGPEPGGERERAVEPHRVVAVNEIAAGEIARRQIVVTGDCHERPAEPPGHVFDEARLAAAGRSLQHHGQAAGVTRLEDGDFAAHRQVERRTRPRVAETCVTLSGACAAVHPRSILERVAVAHAGVAVVCAARFVDALTQRQEEEVPQEERHAGAEERPGGNEHQEVHLDLRLGFKVAEPEDSLEVHLSDPSRGKRHRHPEHAADLQPECPESCFGLALGLGVSHERWQRIGDDGKDDHHVGAEEGGVAMHRRDERSVRPLVDGGPGVREPEQSRPKRREDRAPERPVQRQRVRVREP